MKNLIQECYATAEQIGVVHTLYQIFGKSVRVGLPFGAQTCSASIEELELSVRAFNSLRRAGLSTVGEVVDLVSAGGLGQLRNLGVKTENEIKTKLLDFAYRCLTPAERWVFLEDVLNRNAACM